MINHISDDAGEGGADDPLSENYRKPLPGGRRRRIPVRRMRKQPGSKEPLPLSATAFLKISQTAIRLAKLPQDPETAGGCIKLVHLIALLTNGEPCTTDDTRFAGARLGELFDEVAEREAVSDDPAC